jgi:hypothetical protein
MHFEFTKSTWRVSSLIYLGDRQADGVNFLMNFFYSFFVETRVVHLI